MATITLAVKHCVASRNKTQEIYDTYQRRITTTSHYKMPCSCCGEFINRGDKITQVLGDEGNLRSRGNPVCTSIERFEALTPWRNDFTSYIPTRNRWVHLHCRPSHWYTYGWVPMFCAGFTRYSDSIERRRAAAANDPDWGENYWEIPNPVWKLEQERIEKGVVTKFQALWRGYATRKKYRAVKWIIANCSSYADIVLDWFVAYKWLPRIAAAVQIQRIWCGYKARKRRIREAEISLVMADIMEIRSVEDYDLCPELMARLSKLRLKLKTLDGIDDMIAKYIERRLFDRGVRVVFNRGESTEKIWPGKIVHVYDGEAGALFTVLYSDGDRRTYSDTKLNMLLDECHYVEAIKKKASEYMRAIYSR